MIGKRIDPDIDFELVLDHVWVLKSQKGLKIANPVTQILLVTWTTQAALRAFSSSRGTSTKREDWMPCLKIAYEG